MTSIASFRFLIFAVFLFEVSAESQSNQGTGMCRNPLTSLFGKIFHFCENEEKAAKGLNFLYFYQGVKEYTFSEIEDFLQMNF